MDIIDDTQGLTPLVVLAPPVPVEPHFAASPDPNEIEVRLQTPKHNEAERFEG